MAGLTAARRRAIDSLLIQYLELPRNEQQGWLADTRRRYPRLATWLEKLIESSHTITFLDDSVNALAGRSLAQRDISAPTLEAGYRIGPWEIIEEAGQGGMGRVYRGHRADGAFEMDVAIKQIGQRGRGLADLLQRECRLLARLDHPAVTRLVDAGLDERAGPFLVMEWVTGTDLEPWLKENDISTARRLALMERIAEAVAHAHKRLIVHGDIKPGNVRVREDGAIKLMDFGVSRLLESKDDSTSAMRALTPAFAAPEQWAGDPITPASDIWSLGALLHWLLTGQFRDRKAEYRLEKVSDLSRRRCAELAAIIKRATELDPALRYRTLDEFIDDLRRFKRHDPVSAVPGSRSYRVRKFVRRNPALVGGLTTTAIALLVGISTTTVMYLQAEQARQQAALRQAEAETRSIELAQVASFQEEQLGSISPAGMSSELRELLMERLIDEDQQPIEDRLQAIDLTGPVLRLLDSHLFVPTLETITQRFTEQPLVKAQLLQSASSTMRELGLLNQAEEPQARALAIRRDLLGPDHPDTRNSVTETISLIALQGDIERGLRLAEDALERRRLLLGKDHPETLQIQSDIGALLDRAGRLQEAAALLEATHASRRQHHGDNASETLTTRNNLAAVYSRLGRVEEAAKLHRDNIATAEHLYGREHLRTAISHNNLAMTLRQLGRYKEALSEQRQALALVRTVVGENHHEAFQSMSNIGLLLMDMQRHEEAEHYFERALKGQARTLGLEHHQTMTTLHSRAVNAWNMGDHERAVDFALQNAELRLNVLGPRHPDTINSRYTVLNFQVARSEYESASIQARQLLDQALDVLGDDHLFMLLTRNILARSLVGMDQPEEALEHARKAYAAVPAQLENQQPQFRQTVARTMVKIHEMLAERHSHEDWSQELKHWQNVLNPPDEQI